MRKNLFFSFFRISSVCVFAALLLFAGFCSESNAQTTYEFHTVNIEFREYHDGVGDHTRIAFMLKEAGTDGPIVFTFIDIEATEIWYQSPYSSTPEKIEPLNFWVGPSEFAYGKYDEVSSVWEYDPYLTLEHYYRFKIFDRGPDGTGNPVAPPGTYTFTIVIQDTGQRLTAVMDFEENWQPRPIITGIWFDTDGNLHVENDWVHDGPIDEFSPGSQFVTALWNANFSKGIGSYMPTTMTHTFIPVATLALIGFEGTQEFTIQMDSRTGDWKTRVYSPRQPIVPDLIPIRKEYYIEYWHLSHRVYQDGKKINRLAFSMRNTFTGEYPNEDIVASVELYDPNGNIVPLKNLVFDTEKLMNGGYDGSSSQWRFGEEFGFSSFHIADFEPQLFPGPYHLVVKDTDGYEYESYYGFNELVDLPIISSRSFRTRLDKFNNFIWEWKVPYGLDSALATSVRAIILIYDKNDNFVGELYTRLPTHFGRLFVPRDIVEKILAQGQRIKLQIQIRTNDQNNRSYSKDRRAKLFRKFGKCKDGGNAGYDGKLKK